MDELMEMILKTAIQDAIKNGVKPSDVNASKAKKNDDIQEARKIAKMNKILFDAHIEAGFTAEQATQMVAAYNI